MSAIEAAFCRSDLWAAFTRRSVLRWALAGRLLTGEVLEVGGGAGAMAAAVAREFPAVQLTITDLDQAMLDAARRRLAGFTNVRIARADLTSLPFPPGSFDVVTSYLMLHHVVDWTVALAEIARVLGPAGALIGYDLADTRLAHAVHRADRSPHRMIAPAELADGLAVAGFADVTVDPSWRGHLMRFHARRSSAT